MGFPRRRRHHGSFAGGGAHSCGASRSIPQRASLPSLRAGHGRLRRRPISLISHGFRLRLMLMSRSRTSVPLDNVGYRSDIILIHGADGHCGAMHRSTGRSRWTRKGRKGPRTWRHRSPPPTALSPWSWRWRCWSAAGSCSRNSLMGGVRWGRFALAIVVLIARHLDASPGSTRCSPTRRRSCSSSAPTAAPAASRACARPTRSTRARSCRCARAT